MKRTHSTLVLGALSMLGTIGTSSIASAANFAQTTAAQQFSLSHGFAQSALPTQRRVAPAANGTVRNALVGGLGTGAARSITRRANQLHAMGDSWSLNVSDDGSAATFENFAVQRQASTLAKDPARAMSAAALEAFGRGLIASKLRASIVLGPQEELIPIRTDYLITGLQNIKTRAVVRSVVANRIVFGRRLNGVRVVGGGSTVTLTVANNGALESLRYDWPRYQPAAAPQSIANVSQIVGRIRSVVIARQVNGRIPGNALKIGGHLLANAPSGKPAAALEKLECGYFDPGYAARAAGSLVQPGCVYHVVERDRDGFRQGYAGAVPAGVTFSSDAAWNETATLRSRP